MWMVRSNGGKFANDWLERGIVAIGWDDLEVNISQFQSKEELKKAIAECWPNLKEGAVISSASQLWKFVHVLQIGDSVITYDSAARQYYVGEITGAHEYSASTEYDYHNIRKVKWYETALDRDNLSNQTKNSLGSVLTVFRVPDFAITEIEALLSGNPGQTVNKKSCHGIQNSRFPFWF